MAVNQAWQQPEDPEKERREAKRRWTRRAWFHSFSFMSTFALIWWNPWKGDVTLKVLYSLASLVVLALAAMSWHEVFVLHRRKPDA